MKTYIFILSLLTAGLLALNGCKRAAEHDHAAEKAETRAPGSQPDTHDEQNCEGHADHAQNDVADLIEFSQALQKDFGIRTAPVQLRKVHQVVRAPGEIKPAGTKEAEVVAPFAGILMPDKEQGLVRPGRQVHKGEHLAVLMPAADDDGGFRLLGEYRLAKAEYERAAELEKQGAAAPRRVQEALIDLQRKEAQLRIALGDATITDLDQEDGTFRLHAPISGILADVHLRFGQRVEAGEKLLSIIDPSRVWLEALVPIAEAQYLHSVKDAYFTLTGLNTIYRTRELNGHVVSVGGLLDPESRRVPVIFEIDNPQNNFKPGSYAQIYLRLDSARESPAIPASAILDEDGIPVAIMQVGPEDFRKVVLKTGVRDEEYIEILSGLDTADVVVVEGAYKIKVAANKPSADAHAGHGH